MSEEETRSHSGDDERRTRSRDGGARGARRGYPRKKVCRFCVKMHTLSYKDAEMLRRYTTERGKILPRRITGTCARHQHWLATAIKRARVLALIPFVAK